MPARYTAASLLFAVATGSLGGCTTDERAREETLGTAREAGAAASDDEGLHNFLPEYIRENSIFGDDDLRYEVKEGRVRVHGTVDNQAEREELERRIRRVPGVRDVDMSGVGMGT